MDILGISAWYRAPMGGLQENIRATAQRARAQGFEVRLALPRGPFLDSLLAQGMNAVDVDFDDHHSRDRAKLHMASCHVLHAHPGPSRVMLLELSRATGKPLFFTVHGRWVDSIEQYGDELSQVFCVSESIRDHVRNRIHGRKDHVSVVPNGVNFKDFPLSTTRGNRTIVVASRFDADKKNVVELIRLLWEQQARTQVSDVHWIIAGQGTLIGELHEGAALLQGRVNTDLVRFDGWLSPQQLAERYASASAVIAAGRGAMEAVAVGRPGIADGSGGVCMLFDMPGLEAAISHNFGGLGSTALASIAPDMCWQALVQTMNEGSSDFAHVASAHVREHLDVDAIHNRMFQCYRTAMAPPDGTPRTI